MGGREGWRQGGREECSILKDLQGKGVQHSMVAENNGRSGEAEWKLTSLTFM